MTRSAPYARMRATFAGDDTVGTKILAGTPSRLAAYATAAPWLPPDAAPQSMLTRTWPVTRVVASRRDDGAAQHRRIPHHAHRESSAPAGPDPDDVREGGRRPGRRGRPRGPHPRGGRRGRAEAGEGGCRDRERRRDEQAELRDLRQGPSERLRRREP